jgi:hypothetical protein
VGDGESPRLPFTGRDDDLSLSFRVIKNPSDISLEDTAGSFGTTAGLQPLGRKGKKLKYLSLGIKSIIFSI